MQVGTAVAGFAGDLYMVALVVVGNQMVSVAGTLFVVVGI